MPKPYNTPCEEDTHDGIVVVIVTVAEEVNAAVVVVAHRPPRRFSSRSGPERAR